MTTIGYCVGGTLLSVALAYMAATGDDRIESATFFTTQVDFTHAGDLKIFFDEEQLKAVEADMKTRGYLEGSHMANAFNMLRPNDLIWPYVQKVYMKGQTPMPFDLLYWNSDATRMPSANHSFYLRNCYVENNLARGEMEIDGVALDLKTGQDPDLQPCGPRGSHCAGELGLSGIAALRRAGRVRRGRIGTYRRRRQPAVEAEIPILDRRDDRRRSRRVACQRRRASRHLVALLVRMARASGARARQGEEAGRGQVETSGRRAGNVLHVKA